MKINTKHRGFTLIELIVVIAIIAILGAVAIPRITKANKASKENSIRDEIKIVQQAIIEGSMAEVPASTTFRVKNAVYSRGIDASIPSSLGAEPATVKSTDFIDVTVSLDSITLTMPRGAGAGKVGQVTYLGDKEHNLSDETATTATIPVRDTSIVTSGIGIRPVVDDRTLGNKDYMKLLYKGLGLNEADAATLGDMDRTKQTQAVKELFGDTVTTGKNGVEPIVELRQIDLVQLAPYMTNLKSLKDTSKYVLYYVVSTNRTGNITTTGSQGFATNLITPSMAEEITNKIAPGTLVLMPSSAENIVYTQTSGYKDGLFSIID